MSRGILTTNGGGICGQCSGSISNNGNLSKKRILRNDRINQLVIFCGLSIILFVGQFISSTQVVRFLIYHPFNEGHQYRGTGDADYVLHLKGEHSIAHETATKLIDGNDATSNKSTGISTGSALHELGQNGKTDDSEQKSKQKLRKNMIQKTKRIKMAFKAAAKLEAAVSLPQKSETITVTNSSDDTNSYFIKEREGVFGGCLLIKDDNHWLVEWLAYHYYVLPLRHLYVYIDPSSRTDPRPIFDRWTKGDHYSQHKQKEGNDRGGWQQDMLQIEVWNTTYNTGSIRARTNTYINATSSPHEFHRTVQNLFLQDCMRAYKSKLKWNSWIVLVDTDEFVTVNDYWKQRSQRNSKQQSDQLKSIPSSEEPGSVMKFLQQSLSTINNEKKCIQMERLQMCMNEEDPFRNKSVSTDSDSLRNLKVADFLTYNFPLSESTRDAKNIINIGGIPESYFDRMKLPKNSKITPIVHNPVPGYCLDNEKLKPGQIRIAHNKALFQVYHYTGTKSQREFRDDIRGSFGSTVRGGTKPPPSKCKHPQQGEWASEPAANTDEVRLWLHGFIDQVGTGEAKRLLENVGQVNTWTQYTSHPHNHTYEHHISTFKRK